MKIATRLLLIVFLSQSILASWAIPNQPNATSQASTTFSASPGQIFSVAKNEPGASSSDFCLTDEAFSNEVTKLLLKASADIIQVANEAPQMLGLGNLSWNLSNSKTGKIEAFNDISTFIESYNSSEQKDQICSHYTAQAQSATTNPGQNNDDPPDFLQPKQQDDAPPAFLTPPPRTVETKKVADEVMCCVHVFSPPEITAPGGDNFCEPHATNFSWQPLKCKHEIICKERIQRNGEFIFQECYDRKTGKHYKNGDNFFGDVYNQLGCNKLRQVILHHSNTIYGIKDCQALMNCLPDNRPIDVILQNMGCQTFNDRRTRCEYNNSLVELFRRRCKIHNGTDRLIVMGNQENNWIPTGASVKNCSWQWPAGPATNMNALNMAMMIANEDGFSMCRLTRIGNKNVWVDFPEYCKGAKWDRTSDPNKPDALKCSNQVVPKDAKPIA
jgi:hypothetical protein